MAMERSSFVALLRLARAIRQAQEALGAMRQAERDLGWELARARLKEAAYLLDKEG